MKVNTQRIEIVTNYNVEDTEADEVEYYSEDEMQYGLCIHDATLYCDNSCKGCKYGYTV